MLFSRLHLSSELWTLMTWGKWNATWHFVYKLVLLTWNLFKTSRVIDDQAHSRFALLFELICLYSNLSRHIEERQNGIYCLNFLKQIDRIWKIGLCFLSKATIQWSFTPAFDKNNAHAYRTERPVLNIFVVNTCTLHANILVIKTSAWCVFNSIFYVD